MTDTQISHSLMVCIPPATISCTFSRDHSISPTESDPNTNAAVDWLTRLVRCHGDRIVTDADSLLIGFNPLQIKHFSGRGKSRLDAPAFLLLVLSALHSDEDGCCSAARKSGKQSQKEASAETSTGSCKRTSCTRYSHKNSGEENLQVGGAICRDQHDPLHKSIFVLRPKPILNWVRNQTSIRTAGPINVNPQVYYF